MKYKDSVYKILDRYLTEENTDVLLGYYSDCIEDAEAEEADTGIPPMVSFQECLRTFLSGIIISDIVADLRDAGIRYLALPSSTPTPLVPSSASSVTAQELELGCLENQHKEWQEEHRMHGEHEEPVGIGLPSVTDAMNIRRIVGEYLSAEKTDLVLKYIADYAHDPAYTFVDILDEAIGEDIYCHILSELTHARLLQRSRLV